MPTDDKAKGAYKRAQDRLIRGISEIASAADTVGELQQKARALAVAELEALADTGTEWANENIHREYTQGNKAANDEIRVAFDGVQPPPLLHPSDGAIEAETDLASAALLELSIFALAAIDAVLAQLSGMTIDEARAFITGYLNEHGIPADMILRQDQTPVEYQLDSKAAMLINTLGFLAFVRAGMAAMQYAGVNYVKMSSHAPTCPICYPLQGRVYCVDGTDTSYPPLSVAFPNGVPLVHPNCRHTVKPYFPLFQSPAQLAKDKKFSNRPFDVDNMSALERRAYERQLKAYNSGQELISKLSANRRQWQRYTSRLGADAPSFHKFTRIKVANGAQWSDLQSQYRKAKP